MCSKTTSYLRYLGCLVVIAIFHLATPLSSAADSTVTAPVRFAVIGDRTGGTVEGVYEQIVTEIQRLRPDFCVTVGDMIEGPVTDSAELERRWQEYEGIVSALTMPVHYTPGNNDIWTDDMEPAYRQHIGTPYHSFDEHGLHFVVLDNSRYDDIASFPQEQIDWLVEDLKQHADAKHTFVFMHQPYWYRTLGDGKPDTLHNIFKSYGVDAVFTGHFHRYFYGAFDGIQYIGVGSSGGSCRPGPSGLEYHYMWVTVDGEGVHIATIVKDGVLPVDVQTVQEIRLVSRIEYEVFSIAQPVAVGVDDQLRDTVVQVRVANIGDVVFADTIGWQVPDGWSVEPPTQTLTVPPGDTGSATFSVDNSGPLYPLPIVQSEFAYTEGRSVAVNRTLEIAREVECPKAVTPPVIDGVLSDGEWDSPVTRLFAFDGSDSRCDSTWFYFAHDDNHLYFAARCNEAVMDSLAANLTERDAAVYSEDCVGILYQPGGEGRSVYQLYVNPRATLYDQEITRQTDGYWTGDETWNGEYTVKTSEDGGGWYMEARIPLSQFGVSAVPGDQWRVNFRRKQFRLRGTAGWQVPWSYDPTMFGRLLLQ